MCRLICVSYLLFFTIVAAYSLSYDDDTELDFIWTAATGTVHHYNVYVSKDGREYVFEDTTRNTSCILTGEYGHTYRIRVQAEDAAGNTGPMSEESGLVICDAKLPCDLNDDGVVDISDLIVVCNDFGKTGDDLAADVNYDGKVDIFDLVWMALVLIANHLGKETAAPLIHSLDQVSPLRFQQIYDMVRSLPNPTPNLKLALIELEKLLVPHENKLLQNYPNPFNLETWIPFELANQAMVSLSIYDASGSTVRILEIGERPAGVYVSKNRAVYWDGRNKNCEEVSSGLYFYHLKARDFEAIRRMIVLK